MVELTYGELKQGLICCTVYRDCKGCPLFDEDTMKTATAGDLSCTGQLLVAAMNCINVMEKDLEAANKRVEAWEAACEHLETEIHTLHASQDKRGT
jgi:hypothetical protein